jgi:hypothetical protein
MTLTPFATMFSMMSSFEAVEETTVMLGFPSRKHVAVDLTPL